MTFKLLLELQFFAWFFSFRFHYFRFLKCFACMGIKRKNPIFFASKRKEKRPFFAYFRFKRKWAAHPIQAADHHASIMQLTTCTLCNVWKLSWPSCINHAADHMYIVQCRAADYPCIDSGIWKSCIISVMNKFSRLTWCINLVSWPLYF